MKSSSQEKKTLEILNDFKKNMDELDKSIDLVEPDKKTNMATFITLSVVKGKYDKIFKKMIKKNMIPFEDGAFLIQLRKVMYVLNEMEHKALTSGKNRISSEFIEGVISVYLNIFNHQAKIPKNMVNFFQEEYESDFKFIVESFTSSTEKVVESGQVAIVVNIPDEYPNMPKSATLKTLSETETFKLSLKKALSSLAEKNSKEFGHEFVRYVYHLDAQTGEGQSASPVSLINFVKGLIQIDRNI